MAGRPRVRNPQSKADIVAAAERVVARDGVSRLTLDRVAEEAGISKGGLLYNFPSKQALLEGMAEALMARLDEEADNRRQRLDSPGAVARSHMAVALDSGVEPRVVLAVLAGGAEEPALLGPLRHHFRSSMVAVREDAVDPAAALVAWLAAHTLAGWDTLQVSPFDADTRELVERRLWQMTAG